MAKTFRKRDYWEVPLRWQDDDSVTSLGLHTWHKYLKGFKNRKGASYLIVSDCESEMKVPRSTKRECARSLRHKQKQELRRGQDLTPKVNNAYFWYY